MEKFHEYFLKAKRDLATADHLAYVTFSLIKDKKLLLKILEQIKSALTNFINSVLHLEYIYKRISLYSDPEENLRTFIEKCAPRYSITKKEIKKIQEILELYKKHVKSPMEFVKNEKVIIMSENSSVESLDIEKIKGFISIVKTIIEKAQPKILR